MSTHQSASSPAPLSPLATALATSDAPRFDFPTWLPPMLVKELRQGLRTRGFVASLIIFQCVMAITFMWALAAEDRTGISTAEGFFWGLLGTALLVVTPLRALAALRTELDTRTIDLLLLTRLTSWRIVLGKWVSLMMQALLLVATMLPYAVVRYFFGAVDLVRDLGVIGMLMLGCGMFTAAALWVSGLPKITRILLLVGGLFLVPNTLGLLFRGRLGGSFFGGGGVDDWQVWVMLVLGAGVGMFFCLVHAVRWIAPPAENHASAARLVSLVPLVPVVVFLLFSASEAATRQLVVAALGIAVAAMLELMKPGAVMATHLRGVRGGVVGRAWVRWLGLPGWPSAVLYLVVAIGLVFGLSLWTPHGGSSALGWHKDGWLLALGGCALVTPALLLSFIPSVEKSAGAIYFVLQASFGIVAAVAGNHMLGGAAHPVAKALDGIAHCLPITSFWLTLVNADNASAWSVPLVAAQAVMMSGVAAMAWWRGREYWHDVRVLVAETAEGSARR